MGSARGWICAACLTGYSYSRLACLPKNGERERGTGGGREKPIPDTRYPASGIGSNRVYQQIQPDCGQAKHDVITPRPGRIEPDPENVMLEESLLIWLAAALSERGFFPDSYWAAEVEQHRAARPCDGCQVQPYELRPHQHEERAPKHEENVRDVKSRQRVGEEAPQKSSRSGPRCICSFNRIRQRVELGSKCGFSMIPMLLPNGSRTAATLIPSPTS